MTHSLNNRNFESTLNDHDVVLVDFYADWCGPCQSLAPSLEKLSDEFDGKALIAKVNVDQNPELSQLFQVRSIPALFYFKKGKLVERQVGLQSQHVISERISKLIH